MDPDTSLAAVRAMRLRLDQLERENRDLKRSLYDLSLQHHAVVLEWSKTLPPNAPQLKRLVTVDVSRILASPLPHAHPSSSSSVFSSASSTGNLAALAAAPTAAIIGDPNASANVGASASAAGSALSVPSASPSLPLALTSTANAGAGVTNDGATAVSSQLSAASTLSADAASGASVDETTHAFSPAAQLEAAASSPSSSSAPVPPPSLLARSATRDPRSRPLIASSSASASSASSSSSSAAAGTVKALHWKCDLLGHAGAAYALAFAPGTGRFLASASFDRTVRVWDVWQAQTGGGHATDFALGGVGGAGGVGGGAGGGAGEVVVFGDHQLPVSAVAWHSDAARVVSGSFDQTVRVGDLETARSINCFQVSGFVQSVAVHPYENNVMFVGTNNKRIRILDARAPDGVIRELCNSSAVHSTYVFRSGNYVMSADDRGALKTWDVGTGRVVHVHDTAAPASASASASAADAESIAAAADQSSAKAAPISHIAVCEPRESEEEGRLLAANGWDNALRVFDRGKSLRHFYAASAAMTATATTTTTTANAASGGASADTPSDGADAKTDRGPSPFSASSASSSLSASQSRSSASSALSAFTLTPVHECRSHRNASFPIKSSFFLGAHYHGKSSWRPPGSAASLGGGGGDRDRDWALGMGMADSLSSRANAARTIDFGTSVLLATGSTDAHAYIYDVGGPRGTARLLQRLDGHRDRVYAAQFHPRDPVLATASADGVVKIWGPRDSFF